MCERFHVLLEVVDGGKCIFRRLRLWEEKDRGLSEMDLEELADCSCEKFVDGKHTIKVI